MQTPFHALRRDARRSVVATALLLAGLTLSHTPSAAEGGVVDPPLPQPGDPIVVYGVSTGPSTLSFDDGTSGDCTMSTRLSDGKWLWVMCDPTLPNPSPNVLREGDLGRTATPPTADGIVTKVPSNAWAVETSASPPTLRRLSDPFVGLPRNGDDPAPDNRPGVLCREIAGTHSGSRLATWLLGLTSYPIEVGEVDVDRVITYYQDVCITTTWTETTPGVFTPKTVYDPLGDGVALFDYNSATFNPLAVPAPAATRSDIGGGFEIAEQQAANPSTWVGVNPDDFRIFPRPETSFGRGAVYRQADNSIYSNECERVPFQDPHICRLTRVPVATQSNPQLALAALAKADAAPTSTNYEYYSRSTACAPPVWTRNIYYATPLRDLVGTTCVTHNFENYQTNQIVHAPTGRFVRSTFELESSPARVVLGHAQAPNGPWSLPAAGTGFVLPNNECQQTIKQMDGQSYCYAGHVQPTSVSANHLDFVYFKKVWNAASGSWTGQQARRATVNVCIPGFASFTDLSPTHSLTPSVIDIAEYCILRGWADGTVHPTEVVSRQTMAALLYRLAGSPTFTPPVTATFTDVSTTHPFFREIEWLSSMDLTNGCNGNPNTFCPTSNVTRQTAVTFFYGLSGADFTPPTTPTFTDVAPSNIFYKEIEWAVAQSPKITNGCTATTFCPTAALTRQAFAGFACNWLEGIGGGNCDAAPQQ